MKLVPTRANGQYAFGLYMRYGNVYRPFNMPVLTLTPDGVSHVTAFFAVRGRNLGKGVRIPGSGGR